MTEEINVKQLISDGKEKTKFIFDNFIYLNILGAALFGYFIYSERWLYAFLCFILLFPDVDDLAKWTHTN